MPWPPICSAPGPKRQEERESDSRVHGLALARAKPPRETKRDDDGQACSGGEGSVPALGIARDDPVGPG